MMYRPPFVAAAAVSLAAICFPYVDAFVHLPSRPLFASCAAGARKLRPPHASAPANDGDAAQAATDERPPAPTFNGKVILPMRVLSGGLNDHKVAAVYAIMNKKYKKGSGDGWEFCEHVGFTRDLGDALQTHLQAHGKGAVAHVRALSFAYPQKSAMEEVASQWRAKAAEAGGNAADDKWAADGEEKRRAELVALIEESADFYDDDEDEYEDDDFYSNADLSAKDTESANVSDEGAAVISPFASETKIVANGEGALEFTRENVDSILDEVRPYLISDGGNVAVDRVDEETKNVYLILEGACGSCASSTVTMQMGIERVLKENFPDLGEVVQVEDPAVAEAKPTELTLEAVEAEVNRIAPAIIAMGGVVRVISVDPLGVVELEYRGSNKVQQGLELAIRDVPFVKHVKFVS